MLDAMWAYLMGHKWGRRTGDWFLQIESELELGCELGEKLGHWYHLVERAKSLAPMRELLSVQMWEQQLEMRLGLNWENSFHLT
jgi:hypothetical protein